MAHVREDLCTGRRVYVQTAFGEPAVARLKEMGAKWDAEHKCWWLGAAKRDKVEELLVEADRKKEAGEEPERLPEDAHKVRLVAKVKYKGRTYFASYMGTTKRGEAAKLHTLPADDGSFRTFWADLSECEVLKRYQPREVWDGRRGGGTRTAYTTLGGLADFIRDQKGGASRRVQCHECDSWYDEDSNCPNCGGC